MTIVMYHQAEDHSKKHLSLIEKNAVAEVSILGRVPLFAKLLLFEPTILKNFSIEVVKVG